MYAPNYVLCMYTYNFVEQGFSFTSLLYSTTKHTVVVTDENNAAKSVYLVNHGNNGL